MLVSSAGDAPEGLEGVGDAPEGLEDAAAPPPAPELLFSALL